MPYFNTSLKDNRFIVESVVLDIRSLGSEKTSAYIQESNFEGDGRSAAKALIDTGATHCSITEELAQKLNLIPTGTETIGTAGHPIECKQYLILLGIPVSEVQCNRLLNWFCVFCGNFLYCFINDLLKKISIILPANQAIVWPHQHQ